MKNNNTDASVVDGVIMAAGIIVTLVTISVGSIAGGFFAEKTKVDQRIESMDQTASQMVLNYKRLNGIE